MPKQGESKRRSHAERRSDARERLLNACLDLLIERGYARLTVADVAAKAALSLGAQTNYYRTKLELVIAAAAYSQDGAVRTADKVAKEAGKSRTPIAAFIRNARSFYLDRSYLAMIELLVAARTDQEVAQRFLPLVEPARRHINRVWLEVFLLEGLPERKARELLHMTLFLMRGMALATMLPSDRNEIPRARAAWQRMLAEIVTAARSPATRPARAAKSRTLPVRSTTRAAGKTRTRG